MTTTLPTESSTSDSAERARCILILSEKSSGSSALQAVLTGSGHARCVLHTRHFEQETLYWTKAASILGRPQQKMVDSEVPIPAPRARQDLRNMIIENTGLTEGDLPAGDEELVFEGWKQLCLAHAPAFVEKSPHHLCQIAALDLILDARERLPEVDFVLVGLVRHPLAVIYSQFSRWGSDPRRVEAQWTRAYRNLMTMQESCGPALKVVRYEDLAGSADTAAQLLAHLKIEAGNASFHSASIDKWRSDPGFGHQLGEETIALATHFGYPPSDLANPNHAGAGMSRVLNRSRWWGRRFKRAIARRLRS